ncbi:phage holin family protein [Roseomonas sp. USHLN139]|uniref:phage holin family protein n=1 Tax=Roseomonas sp. USHLN139 TaxID=3081298 RepID=UPI003B02496A
MPSDNARGLPDLVGNLLEQTTTLLRQEIQLARAEFSEKMARVVQAAVAIGLAAAMLLAAVVILLQAVVAALVDHGGLQPWLAGVIVGLVVALVAWLMLRSGQARLRAASLVPERTATQLSRDASLAKEAVR